MKLRLNVATSPQENHRPFIAGAAFIGTVAFILLLVLARETYVSRQANTQIRSDTARLNQQIALDQAEHQELENYFKQPGVQQTLHSAEFLNGLIAERTFPWTKIFSDLEKTLPAGVRVVSIAPKLVNGKAEVALTVGATSDAAKIQFLEAVEKSKNFSEVTVDDETVTQLPQPGSTDRVMVKLSFLYAT
jgi:Tfp pilus assembly protein PilN